MAKEEPVREQQKIVRAKRSQEAVNVRGYELVKEITEGQWKVEPHISALWKNSVDRQEIKSSPCFI